MDRNRPDTSPSHLCRDVDRLLQDDLSPRQRQRVQQHLEVCAGCRNRLGELEAVRALLRQAPDATPPRSFVLSERDVRRAQRILWYPILRSATAVIGTLVLAVALVGWLQTARPGPTTPAATLVAVEETPPASASPERVAVGPAVTQRPRPTSMVSGLTMVESAPPETAYPPAESLPSEVTVPGPTMPPAGPPAPKPAVSGALKGATIGGLFLLGLVLGLTWLAYRREHMFL